MWNCFLEDQERGKILTWDSNRKRKKFGREKLQANWDKWEEKREKSNTKKVWIQINFRSKLDTKRPRKKPGVNSVKQKRQKSKATAKTTFKINYKKACNELSQ